MNKQSSAVESFRDTHPIYKINRPFTLEFEEYGKPYKITYECLVCGEQLAVRHPYFDE